MPGANVRRPGSKNKNKKPNASKNKNKNKKKNGKAETKVQWETEVNNSKIVLCLCILQLLYQNKIIYRTNYSDSYIFIYYTFLLFYYNISILIIY